MNNTRSWAAFLFCCVLSTARAAEPKWFVAPVLDKAPDLSQGLNDPAWAKALKVTFTKLEDGPGDTTKYPTESYWFRAGGSLFVGFKCVNPASPKLKVTPKQLRDSCIYQDESVELFVGDSDGDLYYQIIVDAAGNIFDGQRSNAGWNGDWKRQVEVKDGYWTVVVELPDPILSTVWQPGSCVTIDVTRHGFNADGSGGETAAISPPGVHSPEDKVFLGSVNPALLGEKLLRSAKEFRGDFAKVSFPKPVVDRLAAMDAFAATCAASGDIPLERYRGFFKQYVQSGRELKGLEEDIVLNAIFGGR